MGRADALNRQLVVQLVNKMARSTPLTRPSPLIHVETTMSYSIPSQLRKARGSSIPMVRTSVGHTWWRDAGVAGFRLFHLTRIANHLGRSVTLSLHGALFERIVSKELAFDLDQDFKGTSGWLKHNRRLGTRYKNLATHDLAMIKLAFVSRYLRLLEPSGTA